MNLVLEIREIDNILQKSMVFISNYILLYWEYDINMLFPIRIIVFQLKFSLQEKLNLLFKVANTIVYVCYSCYFSTWFSTNPI